MGTHLATVADEEHFLGLWDPFLQEVTRTQPDTDVRYTPKNLSQFRKVFRNYTEGAMFGVCVLWTPREGGDPQGVLLVGEQSRDTWMEERWERPAWIWGVYVTPAYRGAGAWRALYRAGRKELKSLGFTHTLGYVAHGNVESYRIQTGCGGRPYAILMELDLGQPSRTLD